MLQMHFSRVFSGWPKFFARMDSQRLSDDETSAQDSGEALAGQPHRPPERDESYYWGLGLHGRW
jgi:hypothetical protein